MSLATVIILLVAWVIWLAIVGFVLNRRGLGKNVDDFMLADRHVHFGLITMSVVAAYIWSATLMASAEGAYGFGTSGVWIYGIGYGSGLAFFGLGAGYMRKIFPYGTTVHQFVKLRFNTATHWLWIAMGIAFSFVTIQIQLVGVGVAIETFTEGRFPFIIGPVLMAVVIILYVLSAGLWSSLVADFIMVFVAVLAAVIIAPWVVFTVGGPGEIGRALVERATAEGMPEMTHWFRGGALLNYLVPVLAWSWFTLWIQQEYWQRAFAGNPKTLRRSYLFAGTWWMFIPIAAGTVGLAGWALGIQVDVGSEIYPKMVQTYLPQWVESLFLLMIFAAVTSTCAASMLAVSTVFTRDIYKEYINPKAKDATLRRLTQAALVVVAIISVAISYKSSVLNLLLFMSLLLSSPAPIILMGMLGKRIGGWTAFVASFIGLIVGLVVNSPTYGLGQGLGYGIISAVGTSLLIGGIGSLLFPRNFDFSILKRVVPLGIEGEIVEAAMRGEQK